MTTTKQTVAEKITSYLRLDISLSEVATISNVVSRLGVADVRAFGVTWED
jgi:predicted DNA-binding protein YlxM (UPF0122 family)